jgi:FlaG/FlaF family flagellin (archaellin)
MSKKKWILIVVIVVVVVALAILFDSILANHRPAITSLEAEPERVIPSGSCQISCNASDRDGDELSYNWSAGGGEINGEGATVTWTAPHSEGSYNVTVTVTDGRGGEVMNQVTITVRANKPPEINNLIADAVWILPSGSLNVTCDASDPDGDELSYEWSTTGGNISGTEPEVTWIAPEEVGIYNITVAVIDGHGEEDTRSVILSVNLGTPPAIEKLCVTPKGHKYLRDSSTAGCDYDVWKNNDYDIECTASGTGELVYDWSCTDGEISGEGSMITWTAPNKTLVEATVTVIVSDAAGNSVGKNIVLHVASCTCGSWGLELGCK